MRALNSSSSRARDSSRARPVASGRRSGCLGASALLSPRCRTAHRQRARLRNHHLRSSDGCYEHQAAGAATRAAAASGPNGRAYPLASRARGWCAAPQSAVPVSVSWSAETVYVNSPQAPRGGRCLCGCERQAPGARRRSLCKRASVQACRRGFRRSRLGCVPAMLDPAPLARRKGADVRAERVALKPFRYTR